MSNKQFIQKLGFLPKENTDGIFYKKYHVAGDYYVEIDIKREKFNFGNKISLERETTQNFSKEENWVVFECVNRLLEKGYKPEDIILEKTYPSGHKTSGMLDILVEKNKQAFLMIECKTWGGEFDKEFKKLQKDGGQLFTYFQQDKKAGYLMLYASNFDGKEINYKNEIIKIEKHYRDAGNVKDFYDRWNKLTKQSGIFDDPVSAYEFQSKALTGKNLKIIRQEDSSFIFNRFLEILRHNVVSDKPNAFNKIFTLFLCKIIDENRLEDEQLHFQWLEGEDGDISFQKRLTDLYKRGMKELLGKNVKDLSDDDFNSRYKNIDESTRKKILGDFTEIRLKKNNEFAFKEVFDDFSFEDNAKVVKEVVELLQGYKIRYNQKHQYLGDFFEMLLTTGLKQESGQFFTPVPVAKFIIKSLPIKEIIDDKISRGNQNDLLPFIIDYAAGSGHFLTESMEEVQKIIDKIDEDKLSPNSSKKIKSWKDDQYGWAIDHVYGIEKDYRLVKTAKVSCYLHGDGLAKVIHGDGLQTFGIKPLDQNNLKESDRSFSQDNKQFDIVISNPPYSVSAFKGTLNEENASKSFDLFSQLTDQSSEIECLFIERTKQLLKDEGVAGIILPSSILSNAGIYTKAREILFKYFEIIAITELGSGTFMATGTNTVILFLRRRANYEWVNIQGSVDNFFRDCKDVAVNSTENVFSKYVKNVWNKINFEDYVSLCQNKPNKAIRERDIYKEYEKKIKARNEEEKLKIILEIEKDKLLYFILAYPQKVVVVKSGKKKEEKAFLGYEFSNRRGHEGIHPIQRSKSIDECTKMYDSENQENLGKASAYIYKAFLGKADLEISDAMKKYVFYANLSDMMTFDRADFEKTISLTLKKTSKIESKWEQKQLGEVVRIKHGFAFKSNEYVADGFRVVRIRNVQRGFINNENLVFIDKNRKVEFENFILNKDDILVSMTGNSGRVGVIKNAHLPALLNQRVGKIEILGSEISKEFLFIVLNTEYFENSVIFLAKGIAQHNISAEQIESIKIPIPPKEIQEKIVSEIEKLEEKEKETYSQIQESENEIKKFLKSSSKSAKVRIGDILSLEYGSALPESKRMNGEFPVMGSNGVVGYHNSFKVRGPTIIVGRKGSAGKITWIDKDSYPIDTAFYVDKTSGDVDYKFLFYILRDIDLEKLALGAGVPGLNRNDVYTQNYDLPSLEEQKKIIVQIQNIENKISKLNQDLRNIKKEKAEVLKNYLYNPHKTNP